MRKNLNRYQEKITRRKNKTFGFGKQERISIHKRNFKKRKYTEQELDAELKHYLLFIN